MVLKFGKYKGKTVEEVMKFDSHYIGWCIEQGIISVDKSIEKSALADLYDQRDHADMYDYEIESKHSDWGNR